jgi:dephospho-CoA kinase
MKRPLTIGLTGSIGMGKSAVAAMFADEGVPVFDADAAVHKLQAAGGELVAEIEALFAGTTGPEGVDRKALGAAVLGDRDRLARLEALIHPAVARHRAAFLREHADVDMVLYDIPLLFETGGDEHVDVTVVVSAPAQVQRSRVLARPGMTTERFEHILALQMHDTDKRARADHIIDTDQPMDSTRRDVRELIKKLRAGLA